MIIVGFPCIGKTTVAKKYNNIIDLESTQYHYLTSGTVEEFKGKEYLLKINPEWPDNYIREIIASNKKYDIVFVLSRDYIIEIMLSKKIDFIVALPSKGQKEIYINRAKKRGNNKDFIEGFKKRYSIWRQKLLDLKANKIILNKEEFIEDYLIKNNIVGDKDESKVY